MEHRGHTHKFVKGDAFTPARFWTRIYITQKEYDRLIKRQVYDNIPVGEGYDKRAQFRDKSRGYIKGSDGFMYFREDFVPIDESDKPYIDILLQEA